MFFSLRSIMIFALMLQGFTFAEMDRNAICAGVKQCLTIDLPGCTAAEKKPLEDVEYNNDVCGAFLEVASRGIDPRSGIAHQMFSYLGGEYRVTYEVRGVLPVNVDMMRFLFDHMPFTSRLINAYQGTNYTLAYSYGDKWNFYGDNGRNLKGKFQWVREDSLGQKMGQRNTFWGMGSAKVLMWQLHGVALVFLDYDPIDQNRVNYRLRSIVFPSNAFLNSVMKMDMFRDVVMEKMQLIVGHVESSARMYAKGDRKPLQKSPEFQKIPWLNSQLNEFQAVCKKSGYGQKVWPIPVSSAAKKSSASPSSELWTPGASSSSNTISDSVPSLIIIPQPAAPAIIQPAP